MLNYEYSRFVSYLVATCVMIIIIVFLAFFLAPSSSSRDKRAPYECGFHPFEDARKEFSIHFYIVALLFVAFDLEVLLLIPWVLGITSLDGCSYWIVSVFLLFILGGFIYEWCCGALDW